MSQPQRKPEIGRTFRCARRASLMALVHRRLVPRSSKPQPAPTRIIQSKADLEACLLEMGVPRGAAKKIAHAGMAALNEPNDFQVLNAKLDELLARSPK